MSGPKYKNAIVNWIDYRLPIFTFMDHELHEYPTPKNLNYWWNFGSLAGIVLIIMIVSGIVLAMHYTPHVASSTDPTTLASVPSAASSTNSSST